MDSTVDSYTKGLKKQIDRFGVWRPGQKIELGDIGYFDGKVFNKKGNIKDEDANINFDVESGSRSASVKISTTGAVSTEFKAGANVPGISTSSEIKLSFSKANAFHIEAIGSTISSIKNQIKLGKDINALIKTGKWDKKMAVITEIESVERAYIIISSSNKSEIEFGVNSDLQLTSINLAKANIGLKVNKFRDMEYNQEFEEPLTLTFNASTIKDIIKVSGFSLRERGIIDNCGSEIVSEIELPNKGYSFHTFSPMPQDTYDEEFELVQLSLEDFEDNGLDNTM